VATSTEIKMTPSGGGFQNWARSAFFTSSLPPRARRYSSTNPLVHSTRSQGFHVLFPAQMLFLWFQNSHTKAINSSRSHTLRDSIAAKKSLIASVPLEFLTSSSKPTAFQTFRAQVHLQTAWSIDYVPMRQTERRESLVTCRRSNTVCPGIQHLHTFHVKSLTFGGNLRFKEQS
jgi:hypothetical protein